MLSQLQQSIGTYREASGIFEFALKAMISSLNMERAVALVPAARENVYSISKILGYTAELEERLKEKKIEVPKELQAEGSFLVVNKSSSSNELIESIREALDLPYFILVPVLVEKKPIGIIITGRMQEQRPVKLPLDKGDAETVQSIGGLIAASVHNLRVYALEETQKLQTDFFANISHEFRTPITLTLGPLEGLLSGRYGNLPEAAKNQVEVMLRNQQRLLKLINEILDLTKVEAGKMQLHASKVRSFNSFVQDRVEQFRSLAEKRGIELRSKLDPEVDKAELYLDLEKIDKVIFNLLSNAHKFTKSGHVEARTAIQDGSFVFTVSDTGIGIKADQLIYVFDRFKQADGSSSREYAGTGIGLSLVKELVQLHSGQISVHSEYGKGTTFTVTIPVGKAHLDPASLADAPDAEPIQPMPASVNRVVEIREGVAEKDELEEIEALNAKTRENWVEGRGTILYTDDNRDLRCYVYEILSEHHNVYLAHHGKAGLELALQVDVDLILSDLMMPVMTGTEFLRSVRMENRLQGIPFVLLTAKSTSDSKLEGLETGADDYLSKPFSESELKARIKNLIKLRQQHLRIRRELEAARQIQQALLPKLDLRGKNYLLDALYEPSEELSGDFYDYLENGDWVYFYLADVTSHGTAAAQVTYLLKTMMGQLITEGEPPALSRLLAELARRYCEYGLNYGIGIQVARFNKKRQIMECAMSNAPRAIVFRNCNQEILRLRPGPIIDSATGGRKIRPEDFEVCQLALKPGDSAYFFTDGCYELPTGDDSAPLGYRRFSKIISDLNRSQWKEDLLTTLKGFRSAGSNDVDDMTVLMFRLQ